MDRAWRWWTVASFVLAVAVALAVRPVSTWLHGEETAADRHALPIQILADWSQEWSDAHGHTAIFRGHGRIIQGDEQYSADKLVVWVKRKSHKGQPSDRLTVYLEDGVLIRREHGDLSTTATVVELETTAGIALTVRGRQTDTPATEDPIYQRALQRRDGSKRSDLLQTQFTVDPQALGYQPVAMQNSSAAIRRVRIYSRGSVPLNVDSQPVPNTSPAEQIIFVTGGVNLLIDGPENVGGFAVGTVDLSADRVVIWTTMSAQGSPLESLQPRETPYEVYLEGNIVIRQGTNVIRAERAFYDAREQRALVHNAELKAFLPELDNPIRIRAERIRQVHQSAFHAQNAWITTSEYGYPGYRLQASDVFVEERPWTGFLGNAPPVIDPQTGQPTAPTVPWATVYNSTLLVGEVPLFYAPQLSVPAEDPGIPLRTATFRQDRIFGTQLRTRWDAFQLFGMERPPDARWLIELDYLSQRGPFLGTDGRYAGADAQGRPYFGEGIASYVNDGGTDNLGFDRRAITFPDANRGRATWRHRHILGDDLFLQAELGFVRDRNYLEQYYEQEFDRGKDQETLATLNLTRENTSLSLLVRPQVNQFEYDAQWLPRGDLTVLSEPLFDGLLSWSTHTSAAYARLSPAQPPFDPNDLFTPLPYYTQGDGLVAMSRHEVSAPLQLGAMNVAPYALGEAAFWSNGFTQDSIDRLYGRAGVRGSVMFSRLFPYVQSDIFNLDGLYHKMNLEFDYGYAQSTRPLNEIPQWNEFDDNAQERFRERLVVNTFGGALPFQFDPRFYAVRSGAGTSVTAPYHELVDDQQALRLGWNHRWQTKVGPPERQRIKDWMTLDLGVTYFPDANRDNFGEEFGLFSTRYAWNIGDRTSILASSLVDFFDEAPQLWSVGVLSQRSVRGSLYVGYRQIRGGPLNSQILTASYSYQMSPKWVSTASTAFDIAERQNRGQSLTVSRIGEWFILHTGFNYDASKDNVGFTLSFEPRLGNTGVSSMQVGPLMNQY